MASPPPLYLGGAKMTQGQLPLALAPASPETGGQGIRDAFLDEVCARPSCDEMVPPQKRGGDPKGHCSERCQKRAWDERHGRVKTAPLEGEPYESPRLWLLARLERGPVSTLELRTPPWPASQNPAQRVLELRNRQYDIRTVRRDGRAWYWLWKDGEPVGRLEE